MKKNLAFVLAIRSLTNPVSIAAVLLVLLNDHILRKLWPSWLTGKIGDFAWLVFAPFLLAALLAWIVPGRDNAARNRTTGMLAIVLVGVEFALAKTNLLIHGLTVQFITFVTTWPSQLRLDPTDLVALPALLISWRIWNSPSGKAAPLPPIGWTVMGLAILATLADSPPPIVFGAACLYERNQLLYISSKGQYDYSDLVADYVSADSGASWQRLPWRQAAPVPPDWECNPRRKPWLMTDPGSANTLYRLTPGSAIEKSIDHGKTWHTEVDLSWEELRLIIQDRKYVRGYGMRLEGPLDAIFDSRSGNLVVAMGEQGILLSSSDGTWRWVSVGNYSREQTVAFEDIWSQLSQEMELGVSLAVLVIGTFLYRIGRPNFKRLLTWLGIGLLAIMWAVWVFVGPLLQPATHYDDYSGILVIVVTCGIGLATLPIAVKASISALRISSKGLVVLLLTGLLSSVAYLLPYFVWGAGGLPRYSTATIFSVILIAASLYAGDRYLKRAIPAETALQSSPPDAAPPTDSQGASLP